MPSPPFSIDAMIGWADLINDDERAIQDMVGRFVSTHCMPRITKDFEDGQFADELIPEIAKLGVLGADLQGYGCAGISPVAYGLACHELEYCDAGWRSFVSVQTSLAMYAIWRWGSEEQKQRWLPDMAAGRVIGCFGLTEPDHGSDPSGMKTHARKKGSDWSLTGNKMWITNAQIADIAIIWAQTGSDSGGIRGVIVERGSKGFDVLSIPHKLSLRASHTGAIHLDDVCVPEENRLPDAQGLRGPLACLNNARFGVSFGALGSARFCLERAIEYSVERKQFGVPIAQKQLIQAHLADIITEVVKAGILSIHFGRQKASRTLLPAQVSLLKRNNCRMALESARICRSILGANGITTDAGILRHALNLESTYTYEGTHEIHTLVLGEALTGERAY